MKLIESNQELITNPYGDFHTGLDIVRYNGSYTELDYICAKEKGVVCNIRKDCSGFEDGGSYGNFVHIDHGNGFSTVYAHLQEVYVEIGQTVEEEQRIGYMGATGTAYGGHLHFEVRKCNSPIDPTPYFNGERMIKLLPTPVKEDKTVPQLKVNCNDTMRIRTGHNIDSEIIGFAEEGFYNIESIVIETDYTWYEISKYMWVALVPPNDEYIPASNDNIEDNNEEIELINKDKKNPLLEFIKWIINILIKYLGGPDGK